MEKQINGAFANQKQLMLKHLRTYGTVTSWEAFEKYGITRLSAVIFDLRKEHRILSVQKNNDKSLR